LSRQLGFDGRDDGHGDFVLQIEDVLDLAVVTLGPYVITAGRLDQLRANPNTAGTLTQASFQHVAHAHLLADALDVNGLSFVSEGGVARGDEEPAELGKRGDDVLGDTVGQKLLLWVRAHVCEREHRYGRFVGKFQGWFGRRGHLRFARVKQHSVSPHRLFDILDLLLAHEFVAIRQLLTNRGSY